MSFRQFDISKLIPEEFADTPFVRDMVSVFADKVVGDTLDHINSLLLLRQAGDDFQVQKVIATGTPITLVLGDPFKRGSLLIMEKGLNLLVESDAEGTDDTDTLLDAITLLSRGTVTHSTRTVTLNVADATLSNPITFSIFYLTQYGLDDNLLENLRRTLGLFIDTTGFTDGETSRRLIESIPYYYENAHSRSFIDFLSFAANTPFSMEELFCKVSAYPSYGIKYTREDMMVEGFTDWGYQVELPQTTDSIETLIDRNDLINIVGIHFYGTPTFENSNQTVVHEFTPFEKTDWLSTPFTVQSIGWSSTSLVGDDVTGLRSFECEFSEINGVNETSLMLAEIDEITGLIAFYSEVVWIEGTGLKYRDSNANDVLLDAGYVVQEGDVFSMTFNFNTGEAIIQTKKQSQEALIYTGITAVVPTTEILRIGVSCILGSDSENEKIKITLKTNGRKDYSCKQYEQPEQPMSLEYSNSARDWLGGQLGTYSGLPDTIWYPTSHVTIEYDDEAFFNNVSTHINLFEKITQLFYQLAPIQLVLEAIIARRRREHTFTITAVLFETEIKAEFTDSNSVTGINPGPP